MEGRCEDTLRAAKAFLLVSLDFCYCTFAGKSGNTGLKFDLPQFCCFSIHTQINMKLLNSCPKPKPYLTGPELQAALGPTPALAKAHCWGRAQNPPRTLGTIFSQPLDFLFRNFLRGMFLSLPPFGGFFWTNTCFSYPPSRS